MANVTVTTTNPVVNASSTSTSVTVSSTTRNVVVGTATSVSTATIRSAISANTPISYSNVTGVIGLDSTAPITQSNKISANTFLSNAGAGVFEISDTGVGTFNELKTYGSGLTLNTARSNVTGTANIIAQGGIGVHPTYPYAQGGSIRYNPSDLGNGPHAGVPTLGRWEVNNDTGNATTWFPIPFNADDLPPGSTNQYYTTAKANTAIQTYFGDSANFPFTFNGNLTVNGNIDYVNVNDLLVNDQSITLNYGNATARDAFIYVDRSGSALANAALKWNEATDTWQFSNDGITFKDFDSLADATTDDLAEGSVNLYFSNTNLATSSTTHLPEGTNLYFTNARVAPAILSSNVQLQRVQETAVDNGNVSGNVTFDLGSGTIHSATLIGDITGITFANVSKGSSATLILTQDIIGSRTLDITTYPSNWTNFNFTNDDSVLDGNANAIDVLNMFYDGTTYFSSIVHLDPIGIPNSALANSNVIINGTTFELGSSGNLVVGGNITVNGVTIPPEGSGNISNFPTNVTMSGTLTVNANPNPNQINNDTFLNGNVYITTSGKKLFTTDIDGINGDINLTTGAANIVLTTNALFGVKTDNELHLNSTTAVDNLYGLKWDPLVNKLISSPNASSTTPSHLLTVEKEGTDLEFIKAEVYRNGSFGIFEEYNKYGGTLAVPTAVGSNDYITRTQYKAYDGTNAISDNSLAGGIEVATYLNATATANVTPVVYEIQQNIDGDVNAGTGFPIGRLRLEPSGKIVFNADAIGRFANNGGNANIALDGTFISGANIEARGTVIGAGFTGPGTGLSGIDSFGTIAVSGQSDVTADNTSDTLTMAATGAITITTDAANNTVTIGGTGGSYGNVDVQNFLENGYSTANIIADNITANLITATTEFIGDLDGAISVGVFNNTASTLTKGQAVYITGATGDEACVALANNQIAASMPAMGIVKENISAGSSGQAVTNGTMNFAGHGFTVGADLYVNGAGLLTETIPSGEGELIQKIAKALAPNFILVQGAGRTNATPSLNFGNIFLGNASNESVTAVFTDEANSAIEAHTGNIANLTGLLATTGNLDLNSGTAVDNLYGLKWDSSVNKFISSPDAGTKAPDYFITIEKEGTDLEAIRGRIARSGAFGWQEKYEKAEGTLASPTALGNDDEIWRFDYLGHDGTDYGGSGNKSSLTMRVFQDDETSGVSTGIVPLTYEIAGQLDGNLTPFPTSFMSIHSDGKIVFNDAGTRQFNTKTGTANISRDGTIISATDIIARGNVEGTYFIGDVVGDLTGNLSATTTTAVNIDATGTISAASMTPDDITLKSFQETVVSLGTTNGDLSSTIDGNNGSIFTVTANGGITINTIANASTGSSYTIKITQDGTGSRLLTSSMKFQGGDKILSTGAGNVDVMSVVYDGTDYLATLTKDYK